MAADLVHTARICTPYVYCEEIAMSAVLQRVEESFHELETSRATALRLIAAALRDFPMDAERSRFSSLFQRSQKVLEMDDTELSALLHVARPTIGRWARGDSAPHPIMREAVFNTLSRHAEIKLKYHSRY